MFNTRQAHCIRLSQNHEIICNYVTITKPCNFPKDEDAYYVTSVSKLVSIFSDSGKFA